MGLVVLATAASVRLWGRSEPKPVTVTVVATSEAWPAGQSPVGLELVQAPAVLAPWLIGPEDLEGKVAVRDIPAGVLVARPMLEDPTPKGGSTTARVLLDAESGWWPYPGPRPGDMAVLATRRGGCALAVLEAVGVQDSALVVDLDPALASELGAVSLVAWPAPDAGWPTCPAQRPDPTQPPDPATGGR